MQFDITKKCAATLRDLSLTTFGFQLKSTHAHEIVAAYFGYSSRAALLADFQNSISNLNKAEYIVLMSSDFVKNRCEHFQEFPDQLLQGFEKGFYSVLKKENYLANNIFPSMEDLGNALADQQMKSNPFFMGKMKIYKQDIKLEFEGDQVAIAVYREYLISSEIFSFQNGKKGIVDIFYLKRMAGFIGYIKINHFSTEAENLDTAILKIRDEYNKPFIAPHSNLEDLQNEKTTINFTEWLIKQKNRNSPLGDLANKRGFRDNSQPWPIFNNFEDYKEYLLNNKPPLGALKALINAWKSYQIYVRKISLKFSNKKMKRSTKAIFEQRKIVFVKNVKSIHFSDRIVENFIPGDKAWASWNGRKAIPVTVVEKDSIGYTIQLERPLSQYGTKHDVRFDEISSTPELACINHVTF